MTFDELRRQSFLRVVDSFFKAPAGEISKVVLGLFGVVLALLVCDALLQSRSLIEACWDIYELIKNRGEVTLSFALWARRENPLLDFNGRDVFRRLHAYMGTLILGGTGVGKTSGPGRHLLVAMLKDGFGGLFLCVKADCREMYLRWCEEAGRLDDVIVFSADSKERLNFLDYTCSLHPTREQAIEDVIYVKTAISDVLSRKGAHEDRFFRESAAGWHRAIDTVLLASDGRLEIDAMYRMLNSVPRSTNERDPEKSYCLQKFHEAWEKLEDDPFSHQVRRSAAYLLETWAATPPETRESARVSALTTLVELINEPLFSSFGTTTTVSPDDILDRGKVVIVDWPVHRSPRAGLVALTIWKVMFQRATLAKRGGK